MSFIGFSTQNIPVYSYTDSVAILNLYDVFTRLVFRFSYVKQRWQLINVLKIQR